MQHLLYAWTHQLIYIYIYIYAFILQHLIYACTYAQDLKQGKITLNSPREQKTVFVGFSGLLGNDLRNRLVLNRLDMFSTMRQTEKQTCLTEIPGWPTLSCVPCHELMGHCHIYIYIYIYLYWCTPICTDLYSGTKLYYWITTCRCDGIVLWDHIMEFNGGIIIRNYITEL